MVAKVLHLRASLDTFVFLLKLESCAATMLELLIANACKVRVFGSRQVYTPDPPPYPVPQFGERGRGTWGENAT